MNITEAQYNKQLDTTNIKATIDGNVMFIPISEGNRHYDEIMKEVKEGTLTIKDAD